jgi:hypothetical protein
LTVGDKVGARVGAGVGFGVGYVVGVAVGPTEGTGVGSVEGSVVGTFVGVGVEMTPQAPHVLGSTLFCVLHLVQLWQVLVLPLCIQNIVVCCPSASQSKFFEQASFGPLLWFLWKASLPAQTVSKYMPVVSRIV